MADVVDRAPQPHPLIGRIAFGAALLPALIWFTIGPVVALYASAVVIPVLLTVAIREGRQRHAAYHTASIVLSAITATAPMITLALFVLTFVIRPGVTPGVPPPPNAFNAYGLWCLAWPLLLLGGLICFLTGCFALLMPPYDRRLGASWALPIASMTAVCIAAHIAFQYHPTT